MMLLPKEKMVLTTTQTCQPMAVQTKVPNKKSRKLFQKRKSEGYVFYFASFYTSI